MRDASYVKLVLVFGLIFATVYVMDVIRKDFATVPTPVTSGGWQKRTAFGTEYLDYYASNGKEFGEIDANHDGEVYVVSSCDSWGATYRTVDDAMRAIEEQCSRDKEFQKEDQ